MELYTLSLDPADSWNDIPAHFNDGYNEYEGDQHVNWKTRGYGTILELLMVVNFFGSFIANYLVER